MRRNSKRPGHWLLPAVLILFICQIVLFPLAAGATYPGRSERPDRVLTYTSNKLVWDDAAGIDAQGAAKLSLFDAGYQNVQAGDGGKVVAPGTGGMNIVRLKNDASDKIRYTAVLYKMAGSAQIPVDVRFANGDFFDTVAGILPEGVDPGAVIRAVEGTVGSGELQDFDIGWDWGFENGAEQDKADTRLGDKAAWAEADSVTVGLYIVVETGGTTITPSIPQTGDGTMVSGYIALMCFSGAMSVLLLVLRRWENRRKCERH